jgi:hypothetical protein
MLPEVLTIVLRVGLSIVAQVLNLLYRRIAFGNALEFSHAHDGSEAVRSATPRYGRFQICATGPDRSAGS